MQRESARPGSAGRGKAGFGKAQPGTAGQGKEKIMSKEGNDGKREVSKSRCSRRILG
jgi:hypothetical protein